MDCPTHQDADQRSRMLTTVGDNRALMPASGAAAVASAHAAVRRTRLAMSGRARRRSVLRLPVHRVREVEVFGQGDEVLDWYGSLGQEPDGIAVLDHEHFVVRRGRSDPGA